MRVKTIKTLQETQEIHQIWTGIDPNLKFGNLTPESIANRSTNCRQLLDLFTSLSAELQDVRTRLAAEEKQLGSDKTRFYQGVRATYGQKSPEYKRAQQARGQRSSGRQNKANTEVPVIAQ